MVSGLAAVAIGIVAIFMGKALKKMNQKTIEKQKAHKEAKAKEKEETLD